MRQRPSHRAPRRHWTRIALGSLLLVVVTLAGLEIGFRSLGFAPSVTSGVDLFGIHRRRADEGEWVLALVGTSRFQVALDPERIEQAFDGWTVANLSLIGQSALPVLRDLALDPDFRGVAVVEFMPLRIYTADSADVDEARRHLKRYDSLSAYSGLETRLRNWFQSRLVILNPEIRARAIVKTLLAGEPLRPHQRFLETRFAPRSYRGQDLDAAKEKRLQSWPERVEERLDEPELRRRLDELEKWTRMIQERGGEVVFFRINSSGFVRELEARDFPRDTYWDRFAAETSAVTIHFEDVPELGGIELPEGSHADLEGAPRITNGLIEALKKTEVLKRHSSH